MLDEKTPAPQGNSEEGPGRISPIACALAEVWGSTGSRASATAELYRSRYSLPRLTAEESRPAQWLEQEPDEAFFVAIAIVDNDGQVFVAAARGRLNEPPRLPGRALREDETPLEAVHDLVARFFPGAIGIEAAPIAALQNRFAASNDLCRTHHGLAYRVRLAGNNEPIAGSGFFTTDVPTPMLLTNGAVAKLAMELPREKLPVEEAVERGTHSLAGSFHRWFVRPLFYLFGSAILRRHVAALIRKPSSLIDLAVGDDVFAVRLAQRLGMELVLNDINYAATERVRRLRRRRRVEAMLTQHDLTRLPFALDDPIEVGLLKNVLHHLPNESQALALLTSIPRICRRLVIAEPEDPKLTLCGRIWNYYFEHVLGDGASHDHHFLTLGNLRRVLERAYKARGAIVEVKRVGTIKGGYLIAHVSFPDVP